ncbi:hypothetical protein BDP81DRAFT_454953 [Colletotrichum phormii]|uniref:Uncharacterized protein n=1 Tax=Colletotrichum phormii TaxID=359342 RepID=A0AAI9ZG28_9PEZI|nr:uncharacterized protein BDP81DRAFT_454953 [Colletotrichum phormii]KAK1622945.1 hypothetical protein BDP81DRAFT_454953 [Colletotrichum phormii]
MASHNGTWRSARYSRPFSRVKRCHMRRGLENSNLLRSARHFHFEKVNVPLRHQRRPSARQAEGISRPSSPNVSRIRLTMPAVYMPLAGIMSAINPPGQAREKYLCRIATKSDYDYESTRVVDDQTSAARKSSCRKRPQLDIKLLDRMQPLDRRT